MFDRIKKLIVPKRADGNPVEDIEKTAVVRKADDPSSVSLWPSSSLPYLDRAPSRSELNALGERERRIRINTRAAIVDTARKCVLLLDNIQASSKDPEVQSYVKGARCDTEFSRFVDIVRRSRINFGLALRSNIENWQSDKPIELTIDWKDGTGEWSIREAHRLKNVPKMVEESLRIRRHLSDRLVSVVAAEVYSQYETGELALRVPGFKEKCYDADSRVSKWVVVDS